MLVYIQSRANFTTCFLISLKDQFKEHSAPLRVSSVFQPLIQYFTLNQHCFKVRYLSTQSGTNYETIYQTW